MASADVLMGTTLPTIVGMHVVSKSTETMFGKNGRRRAATRTAKMGSRKIYTGKRGGKYVMRKGRRIYI